MNSKRKRKGKKQQGQGGADSRTTGKAAVTLGKPAVSPHELRIGESTGGGSMVRQIAMQQSWHGPLPPPQQLAEFDAITPGLADRIMKMAEQEGEHSRTIQRRALMGTIITQIVGQVFGLLLASGCLFASYKLAMADREWVAAILGGTTLTTVVLAFLRWRKEPDSD